MGGLLVRPFFDADGDGDSGFCMWCAILTYDVKTEPRCERVGVRTYCDPGYFEGAPDLLYRNEGEWDYFTDVSFEAGVADSSGKGLGVVSPGITMGMGIPISMWRMIRRQIFCTATRAGGLRMWV